MSEIKFAIWIKKPLRGRIDSLIYWMKGATGRGIITAPDSIRLLMKAWDSLTDKKKLKLLEGE